MTWNWTKTHSAKLVFKVSRLVHIYLSTFFLSLLMFFCVTGIFLNHTNWFTGDDTYAKEQVPMPMDLKQTLSDFTNPSLLDIEAIVARESGYRDPRQVDIDRDLKEIILDYPLANGFATVILNGEASTMHIEKQTGNLVVLLNNLHKGRHTGRVWSWVIDASGLFISLLSLSGLVILFQKARGRTAGIVLIVLGSVLPWLVVVVWVPK